jgi:hypothetical protein
MKVAMRSDERGDELKVLSQATNSQGRVKLKWQFSELKSMNDVNSSHYQFDRSRLLRGKRNRADQGSVIG